VDVGQFDFSLLDGARLEANSVTISEDPRFGNEFSSRGHSEGGASLACVASGRFEFGTLSLSRPSLNLVRDTQGRWNIEQWLPPASSNKSRPGFVGPPAAPRSISTARLYRIDIVGGRINFKQGDDKSALALIGVSGRVDQDAAGRWALDLEASQCAPVWVAGNRYAPPARQCCGHHRAASACRAESYLLNVFHSLMPCGSPASLTSEFGESWRWTSRLESPLPFPIRATLPARAVRSGQFSGEARLTGLHGWRLPARGTDPAVNLSSMQHGVWEKPARESRSSSSKCGIRTCRAPANWIGARFASELHLNSSSVGFAMSCRGIERFARVWPGNLDLEGTLGVDAALGGWPLQLEQGAFASAGGKLTGASLPSPLKIGPSTSAVLAEHWILPRRRSHLRRLLPEGNPERFQRTTRP